jgi:hypothetical protein
LKFFGEGVCKNQLKMLFGARLTFRPGAVFSEQTDIDCPDQIVIGVNNLGTHIWNDPSVVNTKTQHTTNMHLCRQRKRARKQAVVVTNQVGLYQLT